MMTLNELRKSKLGMTLIEMIISLVIVSIFMTSTMGMFISSNNIFISTSKAALDRQIGNSVFSFMKNTIRYTTHLGIYDSDDENKGEYNQYFTMDVLDEENNAGHIKYKSKAGEEYYLYTNDFYGGRNIQYTMREVGTGRNKIELTVSIFRDGKKVYTNTEKIKCLNLSLMATGNGANAIVDKASENSYNPFVTFSVDEKLINGGNNAFTLEFNINDFLSQYNQIQTEYTSWLTTLYGDYDDNFDTTNHGVNGTEISVINENRIEAGTFLSRTRELNDIIYGVNKTNTHPIDNNGEFVRGTEVPAKDSITTATNIYQCRNIRRYYQEKIYDLLGFMPSQAFDSSEEDVTKTVTTGTSFGNTTINDGNPYYGVVATKEELYLGFMLKYFDENGDGAISKEEYPDFSDEDTFFAGTSLKTYMNNTDTSASTNKMVIMSYFKDNVSDDYSKLITSNDGIVYLCSRGTTANDVYAYSIWKSTPTAPSTGDLNKGTDDITESGTSLNNNMWFLIDANRYQGGNATEVRSNGSYYHAYTSTASGYGSIDKYSSYRRKDIIGYTYAFKSGSSPSGTETSNNILASITPNATQITGSNYYVYNGSINSGDKRLIYIMPKVNMPQGWYYYVHNNWYLFFYLQADTENNPNNIAVEKVAAGTSESKANAKIVLQLGNSGFFDGVWDKSMEGMTYAQAKYKHDDISERSSTTVTYKTFTAHQFTDYVMYGVDWNSWFLSSPSGILNKVVNVTIGVADFILDTFLGTSLSKTSINITDSNNAKITPANANFSLGNMSNFNISNGTDASSKAHSYNMAEVIYSTKRGTWYYLPTNSTRLSSATSKLTFTSNKDQPVVLDVELNNNETWRNSASMCYDIEQKKMTSSGALGLVDTTSDVMWIALPVGNQVDIEAESPLTNISLGGTTLSEFYSSKKSYSVTTNSASVLISATAFDDQATVIIYNNDTAIGNGKKTTQGTASLVKGTNTIKITSTSKDGKTTTTYTVSVTRK